MITLKQAPLDTLWKARGKTLGPQRGHLPWQGGRDSGYKAQISKPTGSGDGEQGGNLSTCSSGDLRMVTGTSWP